MPTFCRHNRLVQNCPICSREQAVEPRPIVTSGAPRSSRPTGSSPRPARRAPAADRGGTGSRTGVRVRRLARGLDDGYHCRLVPGLKSSAEAERLAVELAFAFRRLMRLQADPPGLYAEVAAGQGDLEDRTWLAFEIAYICPVDGDDPFAPIAAARRPWRSGLSPALDGVQCGPRTAHDPARGTRTPDSYRVWVARSGSQQAAFQGDPAWAPERRFARVYERLALPGLHRDARFDLLVVLGRLGLYDLRAQTLHLGGENEVTVAAKRLLGIGDPLLLERRAAELAEACGLPLDALDLGLYNWERGERATGGLGGDGGDSGDGGDGGDEGDSVSDAGALASARAALGL